MLLTIRNLTVAYGAIDALHNIELDVEKGQIVSIIGANGAGKSTLLKAVSGMLPVKGGEVLFEEHRLPSTPHAIVRAGITHVPEGRKVFAGLTVEENLVMGGITRKIAESGKAQEEMFRFFPILKERRRQQAGTLSGGEQQMLAIARGLMSKPKLLLLDEPSLGLAPIIVNQVFSLIRSIREMGYTILLVEQNAKQAMRLSDYTYVLENGYVRMHGPSSRLLADEEIITAYLGEKQV
jgi:branched-chain amino acid transport system ATP-binding protein